MNHEQIEGFAALFSTVPKLTEIEVRSEGATIRLRRNVLATAAPLSSAPSMPSTTSPSAAVLPSLTTVRAEHVGVFHPLALQVGVSVKAGQALGQIDTMRLLSDWEAPVNGKLAQVLVEEGQPVEYGQPLFELTPEEN